METHGIDVKIKGVPEIKHIRKELFEAVYAIEHTDEEDWIVKATKLTGDRQTAEIVVTLLSIRSE